MIVSRMTPQSYCPHSARRSYHTLCISTCGYTINDCKQTFKCLNVKSLTFLYTISAAFNTTYVLARCQLVLFISLCFIYVFPCIWLFCFSAVSGMLSNFVFKYLTFLKPFTNVDNMLSRDTWSCLSFFHYYTCSQGTTFSVQFSGKYDLKIKCTRSCWNILAEIGIPI